MPVANRFSDIIKPPGKFISPDGLVVLLKITGIHKHSFNFLIFDIARMLLSLPESHC